MRKALVISCVAIFLAASFNGCSKKEVSQVDSNVDELTTEMEEDVKEDMKETYAYLKINEDSSYQTIESFGASGSWWSQYVGGWDKPFGDSTIPVREEIANLLYSRENGIGLSAYRYNLGAGSADSMNGEIWDVNRRAQSFEVGPRKYDFTKDANAVWFLKKVVELGASEITLFSNAPLERLTVNGKAHMTGKNQVNLLEDKYDDFANYTYDVAEHFISEGIPVSFISPINEPQWDWLNGQEGMHYEPKEVVGILKVFVEELKKRSKLEGVELSAPESGEWGGRTKEYNSTILEDEVLGNYFHTMDNHSYWTNKSTKEEYKRWQVLNYPDIKLRASEWCEMVHGKDYTMDSAFNMLDVIHEDLTILDVVAWSKWVAVADGDYRDGLIYVNKDRKAYRTSKRLWAFGNLTKYVRPGYTRVETNGAYSNIYNMKSLAFTGVNDNGEEELVIVLINREDAKEFKLDITSNMDYNHYTIVSTTEEKDLLQTVSDEYSKDTVIQIEEESISTVILSKKK